MTRLDERLRRELERAGRPADPTGVYEELIRRRERRRIARRLQAGALALAVSAGSFAGIWALTRGSGGGIVATPGPGNEIAAVLSSGAYRLVLISAEDGSVLTPLPAGAFGSPIYLGPVTWSPDGRSLAVWYVGDLSRPDLGPPGIYVVPASGGEPRLLYRTERSQGDIPSVADLAWSPDGTRIAFALNGAFRLNVQDGIDAWAEQPAVFTVAADGSDLQRLPIRGRVLELAWAPDGSALAVTLTGSDGEDIYVVDLAAGTETRLTDTGRSSSPAWSPDGGRIAFTSGSDARLRGLFVMNADGTGRRRLTLPDGGDLFPTWSPDGAWIAVVRSTWGASGPSGAVGPSGLPAGPLGASGPLGYGPTCQVVLVRADGSGERVLVDGPIDGACPTDLAWRPAPTAELTTPVEPSPAVTGPTGSAMGATLVPGVGRACDVSTVSGDFLGHGSEGIAYVYAEPSDAGGCLSPGEPSYHAVVVADEGASMPLELLDCIGGCAAYAAPDIDADGTSEVAVSIARADGISVTLLDVVERGGRVEIEQMEIVPPGEPGTFLEPGPIRFAVGGTVGWTAGAYCLPPTTGHDATGARLVVWFAQMRDGNPDLWTVTIGSLIVDGGRLHAAGVGTYAVPEQEPALPPPTPGRAGELCGAPVAGSSGD